MLLNAIVLALREIRRNLLRSSLTTLGIVIGVAAVIVMVTLGSGATAKLTSDIASLGTNLLIIRPGQRLGPGGASGDARPLQVVDVEALIREIPSLTAVAPESSRSVTAIFGNRNWSTNVSGTTNAYFEVGGWQFAGGRPFLEMELRSGKAVCILGETTRKELFGAQEPLGSSVRLGKLSFEVIGLLQSKGKTGTGQDRDDVVLVPLRTFQRRIAGTEDIRQILISVQDASWIEKAKSDIELLMRERRRLGPADNNDFNIMDMQDLTSTLTSTTRVLTALLAAVAAVSLLVGGIGIMNIMLVSVTERTREVGTRLAIGALEREVLMQFLVEAVVLSSFGGLLGVVIALFASYFAAEALLVPFVVDPEIIVIAFLFSAGVGVIFGYLPARRAAQLNPIDALRHE